MRLHGHARVDRRWLPSLSLNAHTTRPLPTGPPSSTSSRRYSHHQGASFAGEDNDAASQEQQEQEGGSLLSRLVGLSILGGGGGGRHGLVWGRNDEGLLPAYPDLLQENLACVFTTPPYVLTRCVLEGGWQGVKAQHARLIYPPSHPPKHHNPHTQATNASGTGAAADVCLPS